MKKGPINMFFEIKVMCPHFKADDNLLTKCDCMLIMITHEDTLKGIPFVLFRRFELKYQKVKVALSTEIVANDVINI